MVKIVNNRAQLEKYRKLSIAALITGILTYCNVFLFLFFGRFFIPYLSNFIKLEIIIILIVSFWIISLPIAAIVCGSIDLKRIKDGRYSNKGKGMDIAGIVLGSIFILIIAWFLLGEALVPH
ncbi:MAG: DUF4190 domain-containing protein [Actinobacteria bacterium]|nr:DUF4190 domain-containing protein [Actinomycetota bacterium]